MMMSGTMQAVALAAMWLFALARLPSLRKPPQRVGVLLLLLITTGATMTTPGVRSAMDAASGVPDLSVLIGHVSAIVALVGWLHLAVSLVDDGDRSRAYLRRGEVALAVVVVVMAALFTAIPRRLDRPDFGLWYARTATVVTYQLLFQICLAIGLSTMAVLLFPQWRATRPGPLKTALRLILAGSATGLLYIASRLWYITTHALALKTVVSGPIYGAVTLLLLQVSVVLIGISMVIPVAYRLRRQLRRYIAYHRLRGLWSMLTTAVPDVVLEAPRSPLLELFVIDSIHFRLCRRVVEIRDAQLVLRSRVSAVQRNSAYAILAHLDDEPSTRLALEACLLTIAVQAGCTSRTWPVPMHDEPWPVTPTLDDEVAALVRLKRMIRTTVVIDAATMIVGRA